jgi:cytoskeletal protein RodZ
VGRIRNNQDGFSAVEAVLILVIIGLIGFVGWYVYNSKNKTDDTLNKVSQSNQAVAPRTEAKAQNKLSQTYTDPSGFTLKYPDDWQFIPAGTKVGDSEYATNEFVSKADYKAQNNAFILILNTDTTTDQVASRYARTVYTNKADSVVSIKDTKINGYAVATVNYKLPGGSANGYDVFVINNGNVAEFIYSKGAAEKDYLSTYEAIVNSIKF